MSDYTLERLDENVQIRRSDIEVLISQDAPEMKRIFEAMELLIDAKLNRAAYRAGEDK